MKPVDGQDFRPRTLEAAESILAASRNRGIPKSGHLHARCLSSRRAHSPPEDAVADLYTAWNNYVALALDNPAVYRLVYAPWVAEVPAAAEETRLLLCEPLHYSGQRTACHHTTPCVATTISAPVIGDMHYAYRWYY
jgi:hypothetical protein